MKKVITFKDMEVGKRYWDGSETIRTSSLLEFIGLSEDKRLAFFRGVKGPYHNYLTDPHPTTGEEVIPFPTYSGELGLPEARWYVEKSDRACQPEES